MTAVPRLSVGLPVYNGEQYLSEALDALLGQSYEDFELIISDNASTDGTPDICRRYLAQDLRIRYVRQPRNIGAAPNHNFVFRQARGELFKWASHDDLYGRDLLLRCVEALDAHPHVVLSHAWTAMIDGSGNITRTPTYPLATDSLYAAERFRSMLFVDGGDDIYGVIRADVLRRIAPHDSYHHADRTLVAEIGLHGPFYQVPDWLYFRRDHPDRAERARPTKRARCANLDPRRADRLRHPTVRLLADYVWGFVAAVRHSRLSPADRRLCYRHLAQWLASRALPGGSQRVEHRPHPVLDQRTINIDTVVAGRERRPA
ncbi:MAG: glycosyltransferase family 2 protein [Pseudonocardiaceae bacterium]